MKGLHKELADLSPAERQLFELLMQKEGLAGAELPLLPRASKDEIPLSFAQERLWFLEQLDPGNSAYTVAWTFRLYGQLDLVILEQAFATLRERHEILRVLCRTVEGRPVQSIQPLEPLSIPLVDVSHLPPSDRLDEALALATEEIRLPFDLANGPLFRVTAWRLSPTEHIISFIGHHFTLDSWAASVLLKDISSLYAAFVDREVPSLPELPLSYADFAHWQRARLQGQAWDAQLAYWRQQLDGVPVVTQLPTDRPRPAIRSYSGQKHRYILSPELSDALRQMSRQQGITLFMFLLGAFQTLLHRYSQQSDIVTGTAIANRTPIETEHMVGSFANTLVLRTQFDDDPLFVDLCARIREMTGQALANADFPFEMLVNDLQPERSLSHEPIVQTLFILHDDPLNERLTLPGISVERVEIEKGGARLDLILEAVEGEESIFGWFEFRQDIFDASTIARLSANFETLLQDIADSDGHKRISELNVLSLAERQHLLINWNDTARPIPDVAVHQLITRHAEQSLQAVAVSCNDTSLTYAELEEQSNQLAHYLIERGVGAESVVGVCLEPSVELPVALLGILKAGGAYLPLDPTHPTARLAFMLADSGAVLLVSQSSLLDGPLAAVFDLSVCVSLDTDDVEISQRPHYPPDGRADSDNLAYVIYTSGSTGEPKGVAVEHRALVNFLESMRHEPGFGQNDVLLSVTTPAFDIAALELFLPLTTGARLVIAPREVAQDGTLLSQAIDSNGITLMQATPTTWQLLLEAGWEGRRDLRIFCGGEALSTELARELLERSYEVWNLYGPTETTIWSTIERIEPGTESVAIGRPIANTQVYVLDNQLQPLPVGAMGELCIGGSGLARGYLNRPDLTDNSFVDFRFSLANGGMEAGPGSTYSRIYKTGDLARFLPDGRLEFLGRHDTQVKIRGHRVELAEIEHRLMEDSAVTGAVVNLVETMGFAQLVAYLTGDPVPDASLRRRLQQALPGYMLPTSFIWLGEFPVTANGKIDRRALAPPSELPVNRDRPLSMPQTPTEEALLNLWGEVLPVDSIGVADNFFDLGGHSLLAIRLIARINTAFEVQVPLRLIFETPTIREQALAIEALVLDDIEGLSDAEAVELL